MSSGDDVVQRDVTQRGESALAERIASIGMELREPLRAILEKVAGAPPRPNGLTRAIGLDKSLAGRLIRAIQSESDLEFMHIVPSPSGLRILMESATGVAEESSLDDLAKAVEQFRRLLDSTPGGRDAIDAMISESSSHVREKAEHTAKRASFKSMSYLLSTLR